MTLTLWAISYTVVGLLVAGFEAVRAGWDGDRYALRENPVWGIIWPFHLMVTLATWAMQIVAAANIGSRLYDFGQRLRERQS